MRIGSYWDETQVAIIDIMSTNYQNGNWGFNAPALAASISKHHFIVGVIFVEACPGSEHWGEYLNPVTLKKITGSCVCVNVWEGVDIYHIKQVRKDVWPIEWFGLEKLPPYTTAAVTAFDHAMGVI